MKMNTEGENTAENQDSKFTSPSPSTQSEISVDGDNCSGQSLPSDSDKAQITTVNNVSHSEPKAKKRRKQSNPIKCPNILTSGLQPPIDDVDLNEDGNEIIQNNKRFKEESEAQVKINHQVEAKPSLHNDAKKADPVSSQQTSTLHSVTSALYNSKMREIEKSHAVTVCAKESSLQSSTDISSPDSNDGLVQNSELKISLASIFPQMPPLLPLNTVDLSGDVSKISNVFSPFSEVSLPHPPSSLGIVQSNRNFTNSSGMRIFNPEAYCELCEKEFCNKYFLKTHKANKHGISTVDSPSSFAYRTSFKGVPVSSPGNHYLIGQVNENGSGSNYADNYCNICQKTFCNKYFLKKHRLNIHGISDGQSTENSGTMPNSIHVPVISSPLPPSRFHSADVKSEDNSVDLPASDNSALKSSTIDVKPSNFNSSSSGLVTSNSNCSTDFSMESKGKALVLNLHIPDTKNEKYLCELCNIEFTDRRYLESHRKNRHGAEVIVKVESKSPDPGEGVPSGKSSPDQANENKDAFREQTCTPCMKTFTSADAFQAHMFETHGRVKDEDKTNDINHKVNQSQSDKESKSVDDHLSGKKLPCNQENENSSSSSDSGMFSCSICSVKCKDRSSLNIHLESEHSLHEKFASRISTMFGIGDAGVFTGSHDSSISCSICQENFSDRNQLRSHMLRCHSVFSLNTDAPPEVADSDLLRKLDGELYTYGNDRQKSIGGRNYCIICNKELCNKYFMKTHMWKMHGIDVDKLTVSGKTASTAGGVFCNICQKVLCSKYFLKVHKQNVHGIFEDVPRTPAAFSTLLGGEASQKEINDEKASEVSVPKQNQSNVVNNQFNVSDDLVGNAQRSSGFCCEICGEEFPSKIFLQIHLVNKHVNNNESKGTNLGKVLGLPSGSPQLLTVNAGLLSPHGNEQLNDLRKEIPRCPCCVFLGKEAPITNISEKQPSQVNSNEENKFHCHICNVSYEFADYFKHHKHHLSQALALQSDAESGQIGSPLSDLKTRNKMRPRKFKRFRCSKCDKKFRTKEKCLHHIQVTHKSKKGLNQSATDVQAYDCSLTYQKEMLPNKVDLKRDANVSCEKDASENSVKDEKRSANHSVLYQSPSLPVPYVMPENSPTVIMQPFHLSEPKAEGVPKQDVFVPSLVYLPVNQKVSEPITVAFTLTPA